MLKTLDVVQVCIRGKTKNINIYIEALCVPYICSPLNNPNLDAIQETFSYLKGLNLAETLPPGRLPNIEILVGLDYYYSLVSGKTIRSPRYSNTPVAIESSLGWIICGHAQDFKNQNYRTLLTSTTDVINYEQDELKNDLRYFWEIETLGVKDDVGVHEQFMADVTFNGERYVRKLPFKPHTDLLPDNFKQCLKRFGTLKMKLNKKPLLGEQYHNVINSYHKDNIIEVVNTAASPRSCPYR